MRLREFIDEARAEELREGKDGVRLLGTCATGRGLLVPWPPMSEAEWEDGPNESPFARLPLGPAAPPAEPKRRTIRR